MADDPISWETIQNPGQLQAALDLEPGRVRVKLTGGNIEEWKRKNNLFQGMNGVPWLWVCLQPGKTQKGLQPYTPYRVLPITTNHSDYLQLRDADGRGISGSFSCSYLELVDGLPLHLALKCKLSCEIVALLLAADPTTASIPDADGFLALHHALNAQMYPAATISALVAAFPQAADTTLLGPTRLSPETTALLSNMAMQATKSEVMSLRDEMQREREMHRDEMRSLRSEMAEIKGYLVALAPFRTPDTRASGCW